MKKYLIFVLCFMLLSACQEADKQENIDRRLYDQYQEYYTKVKQNINFSTNINECSISLILNKTNNGRIRYDIVIDNPQHDMNHIQAIAYVENETKYNPTSIGLLEDESFSLKPDIIDKDHGIYKGINLSGMTTLYQFQVKLYMTYEYQNKFIERFIVLYGDAS